MTVNSEYTRDSMGTNTIRPIVQGIEQLQKLRIATGNRIAAIARNRFKMMADADILTGGRKDASDQEKEAAETLGLIQKEYESIQSRVADKIVEKGFKRGAGDYLPTPKQFQPTANISTYSELCLVDQYMRYVENEEMNIKQLEYALREYKIWTEYLSTVGGIGPKLAGVIISEIDPYRTKYVANLWAYAGLDTVIYGEYTSKEGKVVTLTMAEIDAFYRDKDGCVPMSVDGCPVTFKTKGRDKSRVSLVLREYKDASGATAYRNSITFNPYLKTKLLGVLGSSFLKQQTTVIDGEAMSVADREALAVTLGWEAKRGDTPARRKADVINFLRQNNYVVETKVGKFAKIYYDYRARLERSEKPEHQDLTDGHINARAIRYMVKAFLRELYVVWRNMEGLPIYQDYATAKLGYTHDANREEYLKMGIDVTKFIMPEDDWSVDRLPGAVRNYVASRDKPVGIIQNEFA